MDEISSDLWVLWKKYCDASELERPAIAEKCNIRVITAIKEITSLESKNTHQEKLSQITQVYLEPLPLVSKKLLIDIVLKLCQTLEELDSICKEIIEIEEDNFLFPEEIKKRKTELS